MNKKNIRTLLALLLLASTVACASPAKIRTPDQLTVYFTPNAYALPLSTQLNLLQMARYLKDHSNAVIQLQGHAPLMKSHSSNRDIADYCTRLIQRTLVTYGVDSNRLIVLALGNYKPSAEDPRLANIERTTKVEVKLRRR